MATFSKVFNLVAGSPAGGGTGNMIRPPAVSLLASAVFLDDFNTVGSTPTATGRASIAPNSGATSGYNWYWQSVNASLFSQMPSATAASINNGNNGGGNNSSSAGGLLQITGSTNNENCFVGVAIPNQNNGPQTGTFRHGYFEAYVQFRAAGYASNGAWPGFWSWAANPYSEGPQTEVDFFEADISGKTQGTTIHTWSNPSTHPWNASTADTPNDDNWHTYGCYWQPGSVTTYKDNVQVGSPIPTGPGTNCPDLERNDIYMVIGTGLGWTTYWDWVRVWQ